MDNNNNTLNQPALPPQLLQRFLSTTAATNSGTVLPEQATERNMVDMITLAVSDPLMYAYLHRIGAADITQTTVESDGSMLQYKSELVQLNPSDAINTIIAALLPSALLASMLK